MMDNQQSHRVVLFTLFILGFINALNAFPDLQIPQQPFPKFMQRTSSINRIKLFTITFFDAVKRSPSVLEVFDNTIPSLQVSKQLFKTYQDALIRVGADNPASLAKVFADAVYVTLPFMSQDTYISIIARSMAHYMISQDLLTEENTVSCAQDFCNLIQQNIPTGETDNLALIGALSNGIIDILNSRGFAALRHSPAFTMSTADTFYAFVNLSKPPAAISVVDPSRSIPDATKVYGIDQFALTFLKCIGYSTVLQSVFYSNESVYVVSNAWQTAFNLFCASIKCPSGNVYKLLKIISDTYPRMSKFIYTKSISNAFALSLISFGELTPDNIDLQANSVAKSIETLLTKLPSNAEFSSKLEVIFYVLQSLVPTKSNIINQLPVFTEYLIVEFYAVSPVALKMPFTF